MPSTTMDNIFEELGTLGNQPRSTSSSMETLLGSTSPAPTGLGSPFHESATIALTESSIAIPIFQSRYVPSEPSNQSDDNDQPPPPLMLPFQSVSLLLPFIPTPTLTSDEVFSSIAEVKSPPMESFQITSNSIDTSYLEPMVPITVPNPLLPQINSSDTCFVVGNLAPTYQIQSINANLSNLYNCRSALCLPPKENPSEQDLEGLAFFLNGQVRPGPDVPYIYKCTTCNLEFPTAQAFGGHMSSHSKRRKIHMFDSTPSAPSKRSRVSRAMGAESAKSMSNFSRRELEKKPVKKLNGAAVNLQIGSMVNLSKKKNMVQ